MKQELNASSRMNEVLKLWREEQDLETAKWTASIISEYDPLPFPNPPREFTTYDSMDYSRKMKMNDDFWKQPEIVKYLKDRWIAYYTNMSHYHHLKFCLDVLNENNHLDRLVIERQLEKFNQTLQYHNNRLKSSLESTKEDHQHFQNHAYYQQPEKIEWER